MEPVRTSLGGWNRGDGSTLPPEDYDALVFLFTLLDEVYVPVFGSPHEDCDEAPYLELLAEPTGPGSLAGLRHAPLGLEPFALVVLDVTDAQAPPEELPPELAAYNLRWRHVEGLLQGPAGAVRVFGTVRMFAHQGVDYRLLELFDYGSAAVAAPRFGPPSPAPAGTGGPGPIGESWCDGIVWDANAAERELCRSQARDLYNLDLMLADRRARNCYDSVDSHFAQHYFACLVSVLGGPWASIPCVVSLIGTTALMKKQCREQRENDVNAAQIRYWGALLLCDQSYPLDLQCAPLDVLKPDADSTAAGVDGQWR